MTAAIASTPATSRTDEERAALRWLANQLRWEAILDEMRSKRAAASDKGTTEEGRADKAA